MKTKKKSTPKKQEIYVRVYNSDYASTKKIIVGLTKESMQELFPLPELKPGQEAGPYFFKLSATQVDEKDIPYSPTIIVKSITYSI